MRRLLPEYLKRCIVRISVDNHDVGFGFSDKLDYFIVGVILVTVVENLLWRKLLAFYFPKNLVQFLVHCDLLYLDCSKALQYGGVSRDKASHRDKSIHDANAHFYGSRASQDSRQHCDALLRKGSRSAGVMPLGPELVTICDKFV